MKQQFKEKFVLRQPSVEELIELEKRLFPVQDELEFIISFLTEEDFVGYAGLGQLAIPGSAEFSEFHEQAPAIRLMAFSEEKKHFGAYAALRFLRTKEAFSYFCDGPGASHKGAYDAFKKNLPDGELPVLFFEGCFKKGNPVLFNSIWLTAIQFAKRHGVCAIVAVEKPTFLQDIEGETIVWCEYIGLDEGPFVHYEESDESHEALKIVPRASFQAACDKLIEQGATALEWVGDVPAEFID